MVVGAAAGVGLTPLPWKLIDDSAIWTQNWPWVPKVTRYPELDYADTVCTLCEGGCGIKVRRVNEKQTVKVEGAVSAPINQGGVCPVGAAGPQYQYSLSRFQSPLKRIGGRGSGSWSKMTWAEALKEVGAKLAELKKQGRAHEVVMISGRNNSQVKELTSKFMTAYGSPNFIEMPGLNQSQSLAERAQFGWESGVGYDLENSKFVLSFGSGLIEGWGSPVRSIKAFSDWRGNGTKFVQIDSRASLTASKADNWIAVAPGTEGALALGLAHVIVKEGLYNKDFIKNSAFGFEEFQAMVLKDYTPKKVAAITGAPEESIIGLAREFAKAGQAAAIGGKGRGAMPTPVYELMAVMSLNALVGNINQKGGVIIRKDAPLTAWPEITPDETAQKSLAHPRLDLAGTPQYPMSGSLLNNLVESINENRMYPVSVLILDQADPAFFGADPGSFSAALTKIPLVVTLSSFANDSSIQADIVLPETGNFEGAVDVINPPTIPYPLVGMADPVIDSYFDARPAGDIIIGLAKSVGGSVKDSIPYKSYQDMLKQRAAGLLTAGRGKVAEAGGEAPGAEFGLKSKAGAFKNEKEFLKALTAGNFWYDPQFTYGDLTEAFKTPSGKFEFVSQTLQSALFDFVAEKGESAALAALGITAGGDQLFLPHYEPYTPTDLNSQFPLVMAPVEQFKLVANSFGNAPYLTKVLEDITLKENDLVVEINPHTAHDLHLKEGDRATLKTGRGKLTVRVHLFEGARPGVVYAPIGLGHNGFDLYLRGKGANPMEIVEPVIDPLSGQAVWWGTKANLIKV